MEMPDLLPNRLNADAVVFLGCTMKELQWIVIGCLGGSIIILGFTSVLLFHMFMVGVALSFPTTVALTWCVAKVLQRVKQGKAKGFLKQKFLRLCEDKFGIASPYTRRNGKWSVARFL
jgi:conjugative transfer region protein (TIGR03750 family)